MVRTKEGITEASLGVVVGHSRSTPEISVPQFPSIVMPRVSVKRDDNGFTLKKLLDGASH